MDFYAILNQVVDLLRQRQRVTYRALQRQFKLDDAFLEDLKAELIEAEHLAADEEGRILVWLSAPEPSAASYVPQAASLPVPQASVIHPQSVTEAERRQLTVLFCDLVGSTALSSQLDPEELCEVIRAYQATCAEVIQRFDGYIAQYLGDGLLVYFGYPHAHEDDAQRAVRTGLGIVEAMAPLNRRLGQTHGMRLAVRVGIHTGVVVVGDVGSGARQEQLALGETPNIAARLQGLAAPDTIVISAATQQLVQGYFTSQALDVPPLKGVVTPLQLYQVGQATEVQQRFDVVMARGLTPLVGRAHEVRNSTPCCLWWKICTGLIPRRWSSSPCWWSRGRRPAS
jgi:class 3 adenylate cyclase